MSDFFAMFVHHPLRIVSPGAPFLLLSFLGRFRGGQLARTNALLAQLAFCIAFAVWEWFMTTRSPEADVRIDLLLIWPILVGLTLWSLIHLFRK